MWFKTRVGLVHIAGTFEICAARFSAVQSDSRETKSSSSIGIFIYQYVHAEGTVQTLLAKQQYSRNRRIFLACFEDSEDGKRSLDICMDRIRGAVETSQPICDLSNDGAKKYWGADDDGYLFIEWPDR